MRGKDTNYIDMCCTNWQLFDKMRLIFQKKQSKYQYTRPKVEVLLTAHNTGGLKAFRQAMRIHNINADEYLYRQRTKDEIFPWDFLDMGFSKNYLHREYEQAQLLKNTVPCFDNCKRCGVCN